MKIDTFKKAKELERKMEIWKTCQEDIGKRMYSNLTVSVKENYVKERLTLFLENELKLLKKEMEEL